MDGSGDPGHERPQPSFTKRISQNIERAFAEFLTIPTLIIIGFLLLSAGMYQLDHMRVARGWPALVPGSHESIRTMLGTIASSIITVTSITFSLLLLAVQQGASTLTAQVYDQFLRRRTNQAYFGFFTGLALYTLVVLGTTHPEYTPVYSAILAFVLTVVALYLLILLIYATIDQMRPPMIVQNIRMHTLHARNQQQKLLECTRAHASAAPADAARIRAKDSGYLAMVDADSLAKALRKCAGASEVVLLFSVGDYVSVGEDLAEIRFSGAERGDPEVIRSALTLTAQRDLDHDAAFGIEQLTTIGWTSVSTSKSNPHPGELVCRNLRDLIATWYPRSGGSDFERGGGNAPIVYVDNVPRALLLALESLSVVSSESMQHQTLAEVYRTLAMAVRRMPHACDEDVEGIVMRSLSSLGDHVLTADLQDGIDELLGAMRDAGLKTDALEKARDQLAQSIGHLNARSSRSKAWQKA